jgi:hypothetical protein
MRYFGSLLGYVTASDRRANGKITDLLQAGNMGDEAKE